MSSPTLYFQPGSSFSQPRAAGQRTRELGHGIRFMLWWSSSSRTDGLILFSPFKNEYPFTFSKKEYPNNMIAVRKVFSEGLLYFLSLWEPCAAQDERHPTSFTTPAIVPLILPNNSALPHTTRGYTGHWLIIFMQHHRLQQTNYLMNNSALVSIRSS